jgi:magnesium transporter
MIHILGPGDDVLITYTLDEIRKNKAALTNALWIDLFQPTEEEELFVEKTVGVVLPDRDEMHDIAESSRLFEENDALYLSAWLLRFDAVVPDLSSVNFVITAKYFISIRDSDHHAFRVFIHARNHLFEGHFDSQYSAFVKLLESITGHIASSLRLIEQDLSLLSVDIFAQQKGQQKKNKVGLKSTVQHLGKLNTMVTHLRESSVSLSTLTPFFLSFAGKELKPHVAYQLETVEKDIISLRQYDEDLSSEIGFLLDSTVGLISYEQNQTMKVLSLVALFVAFI